MTDLVGAGRDGDREPRQAVGPSPFGRPDVNPTDFGNVSRFGDRADRAGLLLVSLEVDMRVDDRLRHAQRQCAKPGPSPKQAARSGWRVGDGFRVARLRATSADAMGHGHGTQAQAAFAFYSDVITYLFSRGEKHNAAPESNLRVAGTASRRTTLRTSTWRCVRTDPSPRWIGHWRALRPSRAFRFSHSGPRRPTRFRSAPARLPGLSIPRRRTSS